MKIFFGFLNPFFLCVLDKGYNSEQGKAEIIANLIESKAGSIEQIAAWLKLPLAEVQKIAEEAAVLA